MITSGSFPFLLMFYWMFSSTSKPISHCWNTTQQYDIFNNSVTNAESTAPDFLPCCYWFPQVILILESFLEKRAITLVFHWLDCCCFLYWVCVCVFTIFFKSWKWQFKGAGHENFRICFFLTSLLHSKYFSLYLTTFPFAWCTLTFSLLTSLPNHFM